MATLTATTLLLFAATALLLSLHITEAQTVGVSYGMLGNNLPSPQDVVNLYKSNGIKSMRLYYPDKATLQALQNTNIKLMLGVPNENIQSIASSQCAATSWIQSNVIPYKSVIKYVWVARHNCWHINSTCSINRQAWRSRGKIADKYSVTVEDKRDELDNCLDIGITDLKSSSVEIRTRVRRDLVCCNLAPYK